MSAGTAPGRTVGRAVGRGAGRAWLARELHWREEERLV